MPYDEDSEASLCRSTRGQGIEPPANSHHETEATCHLPGEGAILERSAHPN